VPVTECDDAHAFFKRLNHEPETRVARSDRCTCAAPESLKPILQRSPVCGGLPQRLRHLSNDREHRIRIVGVVLECEMQIREIDLDVFAPVANARIS
jgi:hypothetical protein